MSRHHEQSQDFGTLATDARALLAATAEVAGAKVGEARKRLNLALDNARGFAGNVRNKAVAGAKATDRVVRDNPYKAIAIGLGTGLLVGCILAGRLARKSAAQAQ
jgi:ElaB/YqjD/DUF883 family membrane-anchored ribosome-binding protein